MASQSFRRGKLNSINSRMGHTYDIEKKNAKDP